MKLTVNLARQEITDFDALIREKYLSQDSFESIEPREPLGFPLRAYVQRSKETEPKWIAFLRAYFDVDQMVNSHTAFVLLATIKNRIFSLTFGQGFHTIERSLFEPNFGLRVVANALDSESLKTIDTRNLDTVTRQQRTQVSVGSKLVAFELDLDQEWVRRLSGKSSDMGLARSMSGSDSLSINLDLKLEDLPEVLTKILELHADGSYKKEFSFIDNYHPLRKDDPLTRTLNEKLTQKLVDGDRDKIALAFPEIIDDEDLAYVRFSVRNHVVDLDDLSLDGLYQILGERPVPNPLKQVQIVPINDSGDAVGKRQALDAFLVCELELSRKVFVLSLGNWFEVNRDYVEKINADVRLIDDITSVIALPDWRKTEDEGTYNERVAKARHWTLLDTEKEQFRIGGPNQRNEICDLLTPRLEMICVKKRTKSATLSHLFAQGAVSADLYRGEPIYRERVHAKAPALPPGTPEPDTPVIVYAIGTDLPGSAHDSLFFFSKVNLVAQAREVRRRGLGVAIAKIQIVP
ncbi:uncharacterized protein (TIGR04141 family) [Catenulispora sp. MAP12-49]|uniref:DUF6119 family protein n=1 Tax=Catenulispora sp. MAP12-49 TaxID=3156302 RepID=UPI0035117E35